MGVRRIAVTAWSTCFLLVNVTILCAETTLVAVTTLPGDSTDLSRLTGKDLDGTPLNRLGGLGSAIAYTGRGNTYVLVSDRGPADGANVFPCRYHTMEITVRPGSERAVELKLLSTDFLKNESGAELLGSLSAFDSEAPSRSLRFDPEGIRVGPKGTLFLSEEYDPAIAEFDRTGKRIRTFTVPKRFTIAKPGKSPDAELPPHNTAGRQPNKGFEGLALSSDGESLLACLQAPLIQDGALNAENKREGVNVRCLEIARSTGKTREFVYQLEKADSGLSEIVAINDHAFLVLERDGKQGLEAKLKKVFLVDTKQASDVSAIAQLPAKKLPDHVVPMKKSLLFDLLDPRFKLAGAHTPEKYEGLAFGPDLPDGKRLLLVTVDNDFVATQPNEILAFAIDAADLPGFKPQAFDR